MIGEIIDAEETIRVFIGSSDKFRIAEQAIVNSIHRNTSRDVHIKIITPEGQGVPYTGCTGFTNLRYAVPELAGFAGYAIYLDVDMLVLADIEELWNYREAGKWVTLEDGSDEVAVISCGTHRHMPSLQNIHKYHKNDLKQKIRQKKSIPLCWNVEDKCVEGMKLLHLTDLKCQPWMESPEYPHPCQEAVNLYHDYA